METIINFLRLNLVNIRGFFVAIHWVCVGYCVLTVFGFFSINWIACIMLLIIGLLARELAG